MNIHIVEKKKKIFKTVFGRELLILKHFRIKLIMDYGYVIHHRKPIHDGGGVYDLGNIVISTPRFHLDILDRNYHFNK